MLIISIRLAELTLFYGTGVLASDVFVSSM